MHRHPTAVVLMVVSAVIVGNAFVDILYSRWGQHAWVAGLKQAVTGA